MKQAYKGLTFTGTLYYDLLTAIRYRHEGDTVWRLRGGIDLLEFCDKYGYNEEFHKCATSAEEKVEHEQFYKAYNYLKEHGFITDEAYTRPAGRGWVSNRVRVDVRTWGKYMDTADKYIAAMNKESEGK